MDNSQNRPNLLQELDRRQDEVLQQLDELNARVEALISQYIGRPCGDDPGNL